MRARLLCLLSLVLPSLAAAKGLPDGLKVELVKGTVMVSQNGVSLPLFDKGLTTTKLMSVDLSDDGKSLEIRREVCNGMYNDGSVPEEISIAAVEARLENVAGMRLHEKKKFPEAIQHFTAAAQKDPDTAVYATNLLSAQSLAGKLTDADQTLATYAKRNAPWFVWRLAVDPELKALRGRPSTQLGPGKAGTAKGSLIDKIAYSPLGLAATEVDVQMYDGIPDGSASYEMQIVDVATGNVLLHLPTEDVCSVDVEKAMAENNDHPPPLDKACPPREAKRAAVRRKETDAILAALGFEVVKGGFISMWGGDSPKELSAPDGRKLILPDAGKTKLIMNGKTKDIDLGEPREIAWVPGGIVTVTKGSKRIDACDQADGPYGFEVSAVPTK